jgi:hypothetical protein
MDRNCDDFEIALEQRAAGVLDDRAALDEHLRTCADCTAYAARMCPVAELLPAADPPPDWSAIGQRMARSRTAYRAQIRHWWMVGLPAMVGTAVVGTAMSSDPARVAPYMAGFLIVFAIVVTRLQAARLRRLEELGRHHDLIGAWRTQLDGNLRAWRATRLLASLAIVATLPLLPGATGFALVVRVFMIATMVSMLVVTYRVARDARRTLAELGR